MSDCPCGSGLALVECCGPILSGERPAATAEALMRSRYTAYVVGNIDHIETTLHPDVRAGFDAASARAWAERSEWLGLTIHATEAGGPEDDQGVVEFEARYRMDGRQWTHHETSRFARADGRWFFVDGALKPNVRTAPKAGRNDPCPCGSGKKFKKCCGA